MNIIKLFKNAPIESLILILANLLVASTTFIFIFLGVNMIFAPDNLWKDNPLWYYWLFGILLLYFLKFTLFPSTIFLIKKYSTKESLLLLIDEIQKNQEQQYKILKKSSIIDLTICIGLTLIMYPKAFFFEFFSNFIFILIIYIISGAGLLGSYFNLFHGGKLKKN